MKKTALFDKHLAAGAKMVPFAGYEMPLQYSGLSDEHHAVRNHCGLFDVSHMGEFFVEGPGALDLIQKVTSNDAAKLTDGKVQYSCMPNGLGGIVDDLLIYRIHAEKFLLVVNASNMEKDWAWISKHNTHGARLSNHSDDYSLLAVQGPETFNLLQSLTDVVLNDLAYYTFKIGTFAGIKDVIIAYTGYTGEKGLELYVKNQDAGRLWDAIFGISDSGIKPCGLAARDTLRLEMGFCLYGNDIDDTTSPLAAGLGWITKFTKDFVDRQRLEEEKTNGSTQRLVGFEMVEKGIPRHDYPLADANGQIIGRVTSGTMSPTLGSAIGMGYVTPGYKEPGSEIFVIIREKAIKAKVVSLPFYKKP
jgi:aminomethyltransferase